MLPPVSSHCLMASLKSINKIIFPMNIFLFSMDIRPQNYERKQTRMVPFYLCSYYGNYFSFMNLLSS